MPSDPPDDARFMRRAIALAREGDRKPGANPIGCVIVLNDEAAALVLYKKLLTSVEGRSVMLEEYARQIIFAEEQHAGEVDKMLRKPGNVETSGLGPPSLDLTTQGAKSQRRKLRQG
jgi:hypothetical protein